MRDHGVEFCNLVCGHNHEELRLSAGCRIKLIEEHVVLRECVIRFEVSLACFCLSYHKPLLPFIKAVKIGSLRSLIAVAVVAESTRCGVSGNTVGRENLEPAPNKDRKQFGYEGLVSVATRHGLVFVARD